MIKNKEKNIKFIIEKNLPLLEKIAKFYSYKYKNKYSKEELKSLGVKGLYDAIRLYRNDKNTQFETFAYAKISFSILEGIREDNKIKNSYYENKRKIFLNNKKKYEEKNKISLTEHEYRKISKISISTFNRMFIKNNVNIEDKTFACKNNINFREIDQLFPNVISLKEFNKLTECQKRILYLKYYMSLSYQDISNVMNISKEKAEMIHFKMIQQFRKYNNHTLTN